MAAAGDAGRAGDSVANATHDLYRQYGKQIYAYCLHQLRSREEAEDAVQTTFLNAFRGLQRGTTTRFEQAWLYKIAQNVCIARRSSSGRRLRLEAPDDFEILEEVVPSPSGSAADTLELMGLDDALEKMPESQRRAILLREWQGLSYREIASELDLSQGAVEMLIFRARKTLALALEEPEAAKRRTSKTKTGFSFGSLVAALKGLFSTGAAVKMAAVAVSAVAVGTNAAVHAVVHRTMAKTRVRATATSPIFRASPPRAAVSSVSFVAWHAPLTDATTGSRRARSRPSDPRPAVVQDVSADSAAAGPSTTDQRAPSTGPSTVATVTLIAARAPAASSATQQAASAPPTMTQTGSSTTDSSITSQVSTTGSRSDLGANGKGKGHRHPSGIDQSAPPPPTPPTTTTTPASSDSSSSSDASTTPTPDTLTTTTTTTTTNAPSTPTPTTTPTSVSGDGGSNGSASSSDSAGGHGHGHDGGNGNGGDGHQH